jgi:hypothetical protein
MSEKVPSQSTSDKSSITNELMNMIKLMNSLMSEQVVAQVGGDASIVTPRPARRAETARFAKPLVAQGWPESWLALPCAPAIGLRGTAMSLLAANLITDSDELAGGPSFQSGVIGGRH